MRRIVVLDSGPLGRVANPLAAQNNDQCSLWLEALLANGVRVVIPEIADYEVRREFIRAKMIASVNQLDALKQTCEYVPITTDVMLRAAQFWA